MQKISIVVCAMLIVLFASGCDLVKPEDVSAEVSRQMAPCLDQIRGLEEKNQALEEQVKVLTSELAKKSDVSGKMIAKQVKADMADDIADIVDEIFVQRVGTTEDIEAAFRNAVQEQLKETDKKKTERRNADRTKRREEWADRMKKMEQSRSDKMAEELSLSDTQKEKVSVITQASDKKMRETMHSLYQEKGMDMEAMKKAREELMAEKYDQMRQILDDEQYQSYTNTQGKQNSLIDQFMGGGRGHNHGQR